MVDTYVRDVAAFRGAARVEDDVTIFAVNRA
jgi:hypothetical protein